MVHGLVLASRGNEGKIEVKDDANDVVRGAALGAVGGADELKTTATTTA